MMSGINPGLPLEPLELHDDLSPASESPKEKEIDILSTDLPSSPGYTPVVTYPGHYGASLEEYVYWARVQREEERQMELDGEEAKPSTIIDLAMSMFRKKKEGPSYSSSSDTGSEPSSDEKKVFKPATETTEWSTPQLEGITDPKTLESLSSARTMRIAGATSIFFLITTDILGPSSAPYGMSQNGWAQGNILFFVFFIAAGSASYAIQWLFLQLDSTRYPVKTYGDFCHRLVGPWFRHCISILQFLQLIINCGLLCLSNGQALYQIVAHYSDHHLCFAVAVVIFALLGMVFSQIRTLRGLSFFSNVSTVLNWTICIISAIAIKTNGFSRETVAAQLGKTVEWVDEHPWFTSAWPKDLDMYHQIQGVNLLVFSYGGAMIFPELLSEMKQPRSFWKGCCAAQLVIYCVYVVYACVVYSGAGQYSLAIGYMIMPVGPALTVCNVMSILTAVTAAAIYSNVGLRVSYQNVVEDIVHGPPMFTRKGRVVWLFWSVLFWSVAWLVASSVPQISSLAGLISALAICQFSYSFPFMLTLIWLMQQDAMASEPEWNPYEEHKRIDSWSSMSRIKRGLLTGMYRIPFTTRMVPGIVIKAMLLTITLASWAMSGLGLYAASMTIKTSFEAPGAISTSFGCEAPVS